MFYSGDAAFFEWVNLISPLRDRGIAVLLNRIIIILASLYN